MQDVALVAVAFGTSTTARDTYDIFQIKFSERFPDETLQWAFTSTVLREKMKREEPGWKSLEAVLTLLEKQGYKKAVVQSLHVIPGIEFEKLVSATKRSKLETALGKPLLYKDEDYRLTLDALSRKIPDTDEWITVFVGHGTYHQMQTAYMKFNGLLKARHPRNVYLSLVEGEPSWETTLALIHQSSVKKVKFIPFMFVAGEHMINDVLGESAAPGEASWKVQLEGYEIDSSERGLGFNEKIVDIYLRHLEQALQALV